MINVLFFAQVRELVGCDRLEIDEPFPTVESLRQHLEAVENVGRWRWSPANCWRR